MKIAVIGGAGVRTVIFINGLLARYKALHIDEVALYDINQEKQQIKTVPSCGKQKSQGSDCNGICGCA